MNENIRKIISESKKASIDVLKIEAILKSNANIERKTQIYKQLADCIIKLEEEGAITPFQNAKRYDRDLRIYARYKRLKKEENIDSLKNELLTKYHPKMAMSFYLKDAERYEKDKETLTIISQFLIDKNPNEPIISLNERSYQLFGNEKLLAEVWKEQKLNKIGLTFEDLCCYRTYEPFFWHGAIPGENEAILIAENKDTFYSLKKLFRDGIHTWDGITFSMLVYGEGSKITRSFHYFEELNVPKSTNIYYFGDFDPEGIAIFHRTKESSNRAITWMKLFYREMWKYRKNRNVQNKQDWNEEAIHSFCSSFQVQEQVEYLRYLKDGKYIPQEALSIEILRRLSDGFR